MNHKKLFVVAFCLLSWEAMAQQFQITSATQISLLTCSPSKEIYTKFGHSGIRVFDIEQDIDAVFNYGLFSFETDNFILKFVAGQTDYMLEISDTQAFLESYRQRNSSVIEQILNLTVSEKQQFIDALLTNYEPQNRVYRYNFAYDNCATRPRDRIESSLDGHLVYNENFHNTSTFRDLIANYVGKSTWIMFGIDIIFGSESDKMPTRRETMFLPEHLMYELSQAKIVFGKNGTESRKLVSQEQLLIVPQQSDIQKDISILKTPFFVFLILLFVGVAFTFIEYKRPSQRFLLFDSLLFIFTGLLGCVIFFLDFISEHPMVGANYNILWLLPFNLVAGILIWFYGARKLLVYFFSLYIICILIACWLFICNLQEQNIAFVPLLILVLLRSTSWLKRCVKYIIRTKNKKLKTKNNFQLK